MRRSTCARRNARRTKSLAAGAAQVYSTRKRTEFDREALELLLDAQAQQVRRETRVHEAARVQHLQRETCARARVSPSPQAFTANANE